MRAVFTYPTIVKPGLSDGVIQIYCLTTPAAMAINFFGTKLTKT